MLLVLTLSIRGEVSKHTSRKVEKGKLSQRIGHKVMGLNHF